MTCHANQTGRLRDKRFVTVSVSFKHVHSKCSNNIKYVIFILYVRKIPLILQVPLFKKKYILYIILSLEIYMTKSVNIKK